MIPDRQFRDLWAYDFTEHEIASLLSVSRSTVARTARRLNLQRYQRFDDASERELTILRTAGVPWSECAEHLGRDLRTVTRRGVRLGLRGSPGGWEWRRAG